MENVCEEGQGGTDDLAGCIYYWLQGIRAGVSAEMQSMRTKEELVLTVLRRK